MDLLWKLRHAACDGGRANLAGASRRRVLTRHLKRKQQKHSDEHGRTPSVFTHLLVAGSDQVELVTSHKGSLAQPGAYMITPDLSYRAPVARSSLGSGLDNAGVERLAA